MPKVTVYTRSTCGPCRTLKHWLNSKHVPFQEINVDSDPELMQEVITRTGMQIVPMIQVGDKYVSGLNFSLLSQLLML